jgi:UDP-glucose 4-epimerase
MSPPSHPSVLVVGGAGYIGSHMVKRLARAGYRVTTLDNLSVGHRDAVVAGDFVHADLLDRDGLGRVLHGAKIDLVMHFAASAAVAESVAHPRKYYTNNVVGALNLLNAMVDAGVDKIIFSSTCATYGLPERIPLTEDHPQRPVNPYGNTKLAIERALDDYGRAYGVAGVALRYFNAAGCDRDGELAERHDPETHLIPLVLREAARVRAGGDRAATGLTVFGDDYPTPDGTCVRDYVHVADLATAHLLALEAIKPGSHQIYNLGNGDGYSNRQVIEAVRQVTGRPVPVKLAPRRPGDAAATVAASDKARRELGWRPARPNLRDIIADAWSFHQSVW